MINTNALEKKWILYKIKVYLPYAIVMTSLTLISLILYIFLSGESATIKPIEENKIQNLKVENNLTQKPIIQEKTLIKKETIIQKIPKEELEKVVKKVVSKEIHKNIILQQESPQQTNEEVSIILKPSLGFIQNIQNKSVDVPNDTEQTYKYQSKKVEEKETTKELPKIVELPKTPTIEESKQITITKQDAHDDINDVVKRFEKNRNPALSLFIAKKYYELALYRQSYNYALATNEIDNDIEESWLIFAKSLVKLHEKEMAITMLKKYIDYSSSYRATTLLDEINSGKFK